MTSIFTASDLDGVGSARTGAELRDALQNRLKHNPVMGTPARLGCQTAALDIRYDPVRMDQLDQLLDRHTLSNFEVTGLRQTVLYPIALKLGLREASVPPETFTKPYERELTGPYFLCPHLLTPHPPIDVARRTIRAETVSAAGRRLYCTTEPDLGSVLFSHHNKRPAQPLVTVIVAEI